jgi:hypothetical protein
LISAEKSGPLSYPIFAERASYRRFVWRDTQRYAGSNNYNHIYPRLTVRA